MGSSDAKSSHFSGQGLVLAHVVTGVVTQSSPRDFSFVLLAWPRTVGEAGAHDPPATRGLLLAANPVVTWVHSPRSKSDTRHGSHRAPESIP